MSGAQTTGNIMQNVANAQAAGTVGAANAGQQGVFNTLSLLASFA
jgi:RecA/RadA recombinase